MDMRITELQQIRSITRIPAKCMMTNHVPNLLILDRGDIVRRDLAHLLPRDLAHLLPRDRRLAVQEADRDEKVNRVVHEAGLDAKESRVAHALAPIDPEAHDRVVLARAVQDHDRGGKARCTCRGELI